MKEDSNQSHKVVDLNNGKGAVYSDKGAYYMNRRKHPKIGIRKMNKEDHKKLDAGMDKLLGKPVCEVCGKEVLWKRTRCDEHSE